MPQKTWAIGEETLATDFNTYVQQQVVPTFATNAARDTWTSAPNGALCVTTDTNTLWQRISGTWQARKIPLWHDGGTMASAAFGATTSDLFTFGPPGTYPIATRVVATMTVYWGFGSTAINASVDMFALGPNTTVAASGAPQQAGTGAWVPSSLSAAWNVNANADPRFKGRLIVTAMASGQCWAQATATLAVYPA